MIDLRLYQAKAPLTNHSKSSNSFSAASKSAAFAGCRSMLLSRRHTRQPSCVSVPHYTMSQLNHLGSWAVMPPSKRGRGQAANTQKVEQRCSLLSRGPRTACESSVLSLHVALSFACSVASLSHCPNHYRPGRHNLHCSTLADYLLDQGGLSTCFAGRSRELGTTPSPCPVVAGGWILPSFRATRIGYSRPAVAKAALLDADEKDSLDFEWFVSSALAW